MHPVGHSFGGLVALAVALRDRVRLASLTIVEEHASFDLLRGRWASRSTNAAFRRMTDAYASRISRPAATARRSRR